MQPLAQPPRKDDRSFDDWMFRLWKRIASTAGLAWDLIDKTGSNLTDLTTRNHADLQNINTADYAHLYLADRDSLVSGNDSTLHYHSTDRDSANFTGTSWTDLTDSGATTLHKHDHAAQDNMNSASYSHLTGDEKDATLDIIGTCLISNCALSINADATKFDVAAGILYFANSYTDPTNPTFTPVTYAGSTANSVTNLATQDATYVSIGVDGTLYQTATKPVAGDTRDKILLGALVHTNRTSITSADSNTNVIGFDVPNCLSDISYAIGPINEGNLYSGNVTNTLRIDKSAGYIWQIGINWKNDKKNPNRITAAATTGATHLATWRNGTGGWTTLAKTDVIPNRYDDGTGGATTPSGVLATNKWQAIKIFYLPNLAFTGLEYGQQVFNSLAEAEASKSDPTTDNPALAAVPFRGWLLVRGGATDLNNPSDATFIDAGRFGQTTSGAGTGSSTTSLQEAYLNSSQPQITTDATGGAFQVKRGSAADTDAVFQVLNGAGTAVMSVTGERATLTAPALGTPLSGTLTNCTGLPISTGVSGLGANVATFLATPSSANLAAAVTDETGSGALVFASSPTLTTPAVTGLLDISGSTSGQIKFPATQNPSSDANTLDDYEEGSFTPTVTFATPGDLSVTYVVQVGSYVKIGKFVSITLSIQTSAFTYTTASGVFRISGCPFTTENVTNEQWIGAIQMSGYTASTAAFTSIANRMFFNSSIINPAGSGSGIGLVNFTAADVASGATVIIRATNSFFV